MSRGATIDAEGVFGATLSENEELEKKLGELSREHEAAGVVDCLAILVVLVLLL